MKKLLRKKNISHLHTDITTVTKKSGCKKTMFQQTTFYLTVYSLK